MSLHVEIVTPKGSVLDAEATEVVLPGKIGEFAVLDGHIPLLSALWCKKQRVQQPDAATAKHQNHEDQWEIYGHRAIRPP